MKVSLMQFTPQAKEILIFSKRTRLRMSPSAFQEVIEMSEEDKDKEISYVFGTIGSSWEMVDYIVLIEGVSRGFTHQLVRHRVGVSFAQQAMRVVDASDFEYLATGKCQDMLDYHQGMDMIRESYRKCMSVGAHPQDARGLLPTNVLTNILMKINLRALSGLLGIRLCYKVQGEFQNVAREMRRVVLDVHPWTSPVLQVHCVQYGSCAFPGFKDCPIKQVGVIPIVDKDAIKKIWESTSLEVQPKGE